MKQDVRILALVTDAFGGRGGIAQYNRDFLEAVAAHPWVAQIDVLPRIAPDRPERVPDKVNQLRAVPGRLAYAVAAMRLARSRTYDILYNGHLYLSPLSAYLARLTRTPMLTQLHGTEIWTPPTWARRMGLERSHAILCVSRDTRKRTLEAIDIEPERLIVLPNTVNSSYNLGDRQAARARFGLDHRRALLTVARLDTREGYKGHDRVIDSLPELLERDPHLVYLIAGEGDDRARLEALVARKGLAGSVRFLGYVPFGDLPDLYRAADVFVMPSTGEGFGIVYLEAMACGTPAVGLDVGGAVDALGDGELGHVARLDSLAPSIWLALSEHMDREELATAVVERFGPAVFFRQIHAVLQAWFSASDLPHRKIV